MLKRILISLLALELGYLVVVNGALQLQITQDLVNKIRPEKFYVSWERAWSWYPFRVHAEGVFANGQARTQQWEVTATSASGSLSVLPLILKHVYLSNLQAESIDYRQRPRLKADVDYTNRLAYFPEIKGRQIVPVETAELKKKRPWKIHINDLQATGEHRFWVYNLQGTASGPATGNLYTETRRGAFWLDVEQFELDLGPAFLNGNAEAFRGGTVAGSLGFSPLVRAENPGRRMLRFAYLDADLDLAVDSLDFINMLTGNLGNFSITGAGQVQGRLSISDGFVRAGTQLSATADNLGVDMYDINVLGKGVVNIHTPETEDTPLGLDVQYDQLTATRAEEPAPFLIGETLHLEYRGSNFITPDPSLGLADLWDDEEARQRRADNSLNLFIERATVPDMSALNYHLPPETALQFAGGTTELNADIFFGEELLNGTIKLDSTATQVQIDEQRLKADLDIDMNLAGGNPRTFTADFSGSTLRLFNVYVEGEKEQFEGDYWSTSLEVSTGEGTFAQPIELSAKSLITVSDTRPLVALFKNRSRTPKWLGNMMSVKNLNGEAEMQLTGGKLKVPLAYVDSEKAEVGIKATFFEGEREGVVYARFKKLDTLVKRLDGKRNVDVIKAREKFEAYELP
ncbi:MAG: hypothetical protein P8J31_04195 [Luminiphilus sp.]|nr:hypothetical protein [Luminiphilus sp.]|tara:strand:+ start:9655 stop:11544 length:1890 start_codon:yes stop_codon:yes gene_type:complete